MASHITAFEAKNRLGRLLDRVQGGEEIVITRHGSPIAKLAAAVPSDSSAIASALETFKRVRKQLARQGGKVSRREIAAWAKGGKH
jgi:prevent-host-death family protein